MKIRVCLIMLLALSVLPAAAAPVRRPAPEPPVQKAAILINGMAITPGEVLQMLMGAAGPPDYVQAIRGKDVKDDYVMFAYDSYGISVHVKNINNTNNIVGAIVVRQNGISIENVPFKIGDDYKSVMNLWGQPDRQEPGFMAYWKRGVYVGVADNGLISNITLAEPGKFDDETKPAGQGTLPD
jgi:hypothetical protein